jgi:TetR/AcrR family transcriptional regulator, lmrAB and yxaGH operons repressor
MARTVYERADVIPLVAEVFRELGYHGASISNITQRTGLAKGSLYHFFPGGKEEMAAAILAHVDDWFVREIYEPLEREDASAAMARMWTSVDGYFRSGRRVCLVGAFALDETRDLFAATIRGYFRRWIDALAAALRRAGADRKSAQGVSEEIVGGIQGALVLARALGEDKVFGRTMGALQQRAQACIAAGS